MTVQGHPERTVAFVDLEQIRRNLKHLQSLATKGNGAPLGVVPMVKCNAYGHGLVPVAKALQKVSGVEALGLATLEEAVTLREQGVGKPLWVFSECLPWTDEMANLCRRHDLTPVLHTLDDVKRIVTKSPKLGFHLKINTGLNRLGLDVEQLPGALRFLKNKKAALKGLCTHFASADQPRHRQAQQQASLFKQAINDFAFLQPREHPLYIHATATSGIAEIKNLGLAGLCTSIRPGLGLYGYGLKPSVGLRPALRWRVRILKTRTLKAGDRVGYGGTYVARGPIPEAVLACGYGDGLMRSLSHKELGGRPVLGRVSMDLTTIHGAGLRPGQWITMLGENQRQGEKLAKDAGTIVYEILTAISLRVPRIYECD